MIFMKNIVIWKAMQIPQTKRHEWLNIVSRRTSLSHKIRLFYLFCLSIDKILGNEKITWNYLILVKEWTNERTWMKKKPNEMKWIEYVYLSLVNYFCPKYIALFYVYFVNTSFDFLLFLNGFKLEFITSLLELNSLLNKKPIVCMFFALELEHLKILTVYLFHPWLFVALTIRITYN